MAYLEDFCLLNSEGKYLCQYEVSVWNENAYCEIQKFFLSASELQQEESYIYVQKQQEESLILCTEHSPHR